MIMRITWEIIPQQLSICLGKLDFVDHVDTVEPIVFVMLTCAFRYGHDDLDVIGSTFRKDLETIAANSSFSKSFVVTPLLTTNCQKQGLVLDGKLKHGNTNLASSTIKEFLGMLMSYKVRVKLVVSSGG
ncbi:arrestin 3 [Rhinolophus ferrumequinum]|uniref:Arrestin-C n=1 Tax=Rhinolophus ferrumequinum TaxID=59479 RepID=A0A7J8ATS3_RHIFE|nr:arrestin 3 [Rhinolophus ferrumequinum]